MLVIFESVLPIFLLVLFGTALKRLPLIDRSFWDGLDEFGYFVLFPALLFLTLSRADFSSISSGTVVLTAVLAVLVMSALVLALWPVARRLGIAAASFSTIFQTATRWNAFMALAIAEKVAGPVGLTLIAVVMAAVIIPINFINVGVLIWFSGGKRDIRLFVARLVRNPIILGAALGVAVNLAGLPLYEPLVVAIDLVARSSLGLGLIMVGAGLRLADALRPGPISLFACFLKLLFFPALIAGIGFFLGIRGDTLVMLALAGSVPTAMNGYLLAKQLGGDAPLYAAIATLQTAAAFFTIPLVLWAAGYIAVG